MYVLCVICMSICMYVHSYVYSQLQLLATMLPTCYTYVCIASYPCMHGNTQWSNAVCMSVCLFVCLSVLYRYLISRVHNYLLLIFIMCAFVVRQHACQYALIRNICLKCILSVKNICCLHWSVLAHCMSSLYQAIIYIKSS